MRRSGVTAHEDKLDRPRGEAERLCYLRPLTPQRSMTRALPTLLCLLFSALPLARLAAQDSDQAIAELKNLSLEQLMELEVVTVSRHEQPLADAPAAVSVVTAEDIRRSGVSTLADALRLADGVTVARFNNGTWAVSARGFTSNAANKLLVQIDGRSVYTPLFAGVFWDAQDALLEDVDRIEVIRGPAGAVWGANAVNGVVNILSKPARETQGTLVTLGGGTRELGGGGVRHGGALGSAGYYRAYAKGTYFDSPVFASGLDAHERRRHLQGGGRADWTLPGGAELTAQGDLYSGRMGLIDRPDLEYAGGNVLARYGRRTGARSRLQVQGYVDRTHRFVPRQVTEDRTTFDIEAQHQVVGVRHDLVWGGGYRVSADRTDGTVVFFEPARRTIPLFSVFAQDEIALRPQRLHLVAGAKVEHTGFTGVEFQPSVRLSASMAHEQTLWGAVSRAVRTPTRFDQDIRVPIGPVIAIEGNPDFESEHVIAYEAGYRLRPLPRVSLDLAAFYNRYTELRSQEPPPGGGLPIVLGNGYRGRGAGVEVAGNVQAAARWLLHASYTFTSVDLEPAPGSRDVTGGVSEANDPRHQFAMRSYLDLPGAFELDAFFRAIGEIETLAVPAYAELNLRFGWRVTGTVDLSVVGRDLLHDRHPEFGPPPGRHEFQREALGRVTWRF
jgi:iron complex outermembrane receptor protein